MHEGSMIAMDIFNSNGGGLLSDLEYFLADKGKDNLLIIS
jgi:hypothetical protein